MLEGDLRVLAGDRIRTVRQGESLVVPKFMPHAFGATPDSPARVLIVLTPGVERFEYFRLLARVQEQTASLADLAAAQEEYDNHFVDAPEWWSDRAATRGQR